MVTGGCRDQLRPGACLLPLPRGNTSVTDGSLWPLLRRRRVKCCPPLPPSGADLIGRTDCCCQNALGRTYLTDRCGNHLALRGWGKHRPRGVGQGAEPDAEIRAGRGREQAWAGQAPRPEMLRGRRGRQQPGALC